MEAGHQAKMEIKDDLQASWGSYSLISMQTILAKARLEPERRHSQPIALQSRRVQLGVRCEETKRFQSEKMPGVFGHTVEPRRGGIK